MAEAIAVSGAVSGTDKTLSFETGKLALQADGAVVARIGDEVTVKRLKRTRTTIELLPENPDFEPIVIPFGDVDFDACE